MNYLIIITIIIIIVFLYYTYYNRYSYLEKQLYNGSKLDGYRLADIVFYPDYLLHTDKDSIISHLYKYPDSVGVKYIKRKYPLLNTIKTQKDISTFNYKQLEKDISNNKGIDINLLKQIINEVPNKDNKVLNNTTLILHIRVGDILCMYNSHAAKQYSKKGDTEWWNRVVNYIRLNNITKIYILSGSHFKNCLYKSIVYLEDRKQFLKNLTSIEPEYRIGNSPDDDFMFSINAKHFITTGGGYGYFLGNIVKQNGGNFALNDTAGVNISAKLF